MGLINSNLEEKSALRAQGVTAQMENINQNALNAKNASLLAEVASASANSEVSAMLTTGFGFGSSETPEAGS